MIFMYTYKKIMYTCILNYVCMNIIMYTCMHNYVYMQDKYVYMYT